MSEYTDVLRGIINIDVTQAITSIASLEKEVVKFQTLLSKPLNIWKSVNGGAYQEQMQKILEVQKLGTQPTAEKFNFGDMNTGREKILGALDKSLSEAGGSFGAERFLAPLREDMGNLPVEKLDVSGALMRIMAAETKKSFNFFQQMGYAVKRMDAPIRALQRSMLILGLSVMFAGMALQRYMSTAFNAIKETYKMATGEQSEFSQETNKLAAAWEFLKFSLMDALMNSGIFTAIVEGIIQLVNWFAKLPEGVRTLTVIGIVLGLILGTFMLIGGQILTFLNGILGLPRAILEAKKAFDELGAVLKLMDFTQFFKWAGVLIVAALAIWALVEIFKSDLHPTLKIILASLTLIVAALAVMLLLGIAISLPLIVLIAIIAIIVAGIISLSQQLGGVGRAFAAVGMTALIVFAAIGDVIKEVILSPLKLVVGIINGIIDAYNFITKKDMAHIDLPEWMDFGSATKSAWDYMNKHVTAWKNESGSDLVPSISTDGVITANAEQVAEQKTTNELLKENNDLMKQQLESAQNQKLSNGMTYYDIMGKFDEYNSQYNGSTGA